MYTTKAGVSHVHAKRHASLSLSFIIPSTCPFPIKFSIFHFQYENLEKEKHLCYIQGFKGKKNFSNLSAVCVLCVIITQGKFSKPFLSRLLYLSTILSNNVDENSWIIN